MNLAPVLFLFGGTAMRKQITLAFVTMAIILALPVMAVFSLGRSAVTFLASTPNAEAAATQGFYMGEPVEGNTYAWGNCTYWSFAMRLWAGSPIPTSWGNANTWDDRAESDGYVVNKTPAAGAILQSDVGQYGHVAYVTSVDGGTGKWTISEMNFPNFNVVTTRTFSEESAAYYKFIHSKKGTDPWTPAPILSSSKLTGNSSSRL